MGTNKGFTGQYNDSVTGLDYYNARYYDPVAGVFLSADVVQGNGQGMNPYVYVGGNPETMNDPTGNVVMCPDPSGCGSSGSGGASGGSSGGATGGSASFSTGYGCGSCTFDTSSANPPQGCATIECKVFAQTQQDVFQQVPVGVSVGNLICNVAPVCIMAPSFQIKTIMIYQGTLVETVQLCSLTFFCLEDNSDESNGGPHTSNSNRKLLNMAEDIAAMGDEAGGAGKGIDSGTGAGEQAGNVQPTEPPGSLGRGTIFSHFTNATGANGITGVDPESLNVGQTVSVSELNFGQGINTFLAEGPGEIFVTELGADATPGQLERIGVFGDKQSFVVQFSQEAALLNDVRVSPVRPERSIFSILGGSTLKDFEFLLTRLQ